MLRVPTCTLLVIVVTAPASSGQEDQRWSEAKVEHSYIAMLSEVERCEKRAMGVLEDPAFSKRPKAALYAIKYLERVRSTAAIPILCERLLYTPEAEEQADPVGIWEAYPAAKALLAIGPKAVDPLLLKIGSSETSPKYQEVAFKVIVDVLDRDKAILPILNQFQRQALLCYKQSDLEKYKSYKDYDPVRFAKFKDMLIVRYHIR